MGIRGLAANLEPFTFSVHFNADDSTSKRSAVIDGPGAAYHAFALASNEVSHSGIPSYHQIRSALLDWLDQLERHGILIAKIFFDGCLPASKRSERLSRLQGSLRNLIKFKATYNAGVSRTTDTTYSSRSLFATNLTRLGPLCCPFLVPTVLEALSVSIYADRISVVPGEADDWCVGHARDIGGIIITGDSDLLVNDLGPRGFVVLFKDLDFQKSIDASQSKLRARCYHPAEIAARLRLKSILPLAYTTTKDPYKSFNENLEAARKCDVKSASYLDFATCHGHEPPSPASFANAETPLQDTLLHSLQHLDPRVSEYIHQILPSFSSGSTGTPRQVNVYLPFLVEDPDRSSAWSQGHHLRLLGYSMMTTNQESARTITEIFRRGFAMMEKEWVLYRPRETLSGCSQLTSAIEEWSATYGYLPNAQMWRLFAIHHMLSESSYDRVKIFARHTHAETVLEAVSDEQSWEQIHLHAQVQAFLYSLRVLFQITLVFVFGSRSRIENEDLIHAVTQLHHVLCRLPPIHELFPRVRQEHPDNEDDRVRAIVEMYASLGVEERKTSPTRTQTRKARKRKARRERHGQNSETIQHNRPLNMYSVLNAD